MSKIKITILFLFVIGLNYLNSQQYISPKYEFRGIWIATVANIDWPLNTNDSIEKQKQDFIKILDTYKELNYNAVIVQIRSIGDAIYPSKFAPWSRFLSGKEGKAPQDNFDFLKWMIEESHDRSFEFHAWLNPYRATINDDLKSLDQNHDVNKHSDWMIKYGDKYYYNPGLPQVEKHLINIIEEVVKNYDIDAIHFDDYFYPYKITGKEFNDKESHQKYGNDLSLDDWRRNNVNQLVKNLSIEIKKIKPWVQFGISPFGVWRNKDKDPKGSDTEAGQTNYDDLYADPIMWMENKWIDYLIPQLYWSMDFKKASYKVLIDWWANNSKNTNIYIGNGVYKINNDKDTNWKNPEEIPNQINANRQYTNLQGNAFFSAKGFINKNKDVTQILKEKNYKFKALNPVVPSLKKINPFKPEIIYITQKNDKHHFYLYESLNHKNRYIVIYANNNTLDHNNPEQIIDKIYLKNDSEGTMISINKKQLENKNIVGFSFIDFYGNESEITSILIK